VCTLILRDTVHVRVCSTFRAELITGANTHGQRLLCDPGFGMSLLRPIPMTDGAEDDYLAGWERSPWTGADGTPAEVLDRVCTELDEEWPAARIARYLDGLGR